MVKYNFKNDYSVVGDEKILQILIDNSLNTFEAYGEDSVLKNIEKSLSEKANKSVHVYFTSGGTQTNLVAISKMLASYEAVISVDSGHINVHETQAIEGSGHKVITVLNNNGKIDVESIKQILDSHSDCHMAKPKMVYISNSTELGTTYSLEELRKIYDFCRKNELFFYIDGARLPHAMYSENITLKDLINTCDAFYLGGTKNGLPYGEMLVLSNKTINSFFRYHLKNKGAMLAKTFVLSLMFEKYLEDDYYISLAKNACLSKQFLEDELIKLGFKVVYPNKTNQLFVQVSKDLYEKLKSLCDISIWEQTDDYIIVRFVTGFNTTITYCESFIEKLKLI